MGRASKGLGDTGGRIKKEGATSRLRSRSKLDSSLTNYRKKNVELLGRYSYEWINGQKPHLIKDGIRIICNTENFVPIVVLGLTSSSSTSSSSLRTPIKQKSHSSSSSSSSSPSSPTVGEIPVREREDAPDCDISPVPVSELVHDRSRKPVETQANQIPKPNEKETTIER